uniref:CUB-like domain-containing protein n=1 Tax=Caenorhabditis japonica TaxID=281687 RepID=A0A8R1DVF3_CAEJA
MKLFLLTFLFLSLLAEGNDNLREFKTLKNCASTNDGFNSSSSFFAIPYSDTEEQIKNIRVQIFDDAGTFTLFESSGEEKVKQQAIDPTKSYKLCYQTAEGSDFTIGSMTGKVYFVNDDFKNTTVYQSVSEYAVDVQTQYTVIFSSSGNGSTLKKFTSVGNETAFTLYSGLPGDVSSVALFVYNPLYTLDELYFQEDHFHIKSTGKSFEFVVSNGGEEAKKKVFQKTGFILSPGFPNAPSGDYTDLTVQLQPDANNDRLINFQVSIASTSPSSIEEQMAELTSAQSSGVTIKCGETATQGSTVQFDFPLLAKENNFKVNAGSGYVIQFEITDAPTTPKPSETTTAKPGTSKHPNNSTIGPSVTCPPVTTRPSGTTCPPVTSCPPVTECPCMITSTTTEISTTTDSSTTFTVTSAFTILFIYLLV